MTTEPQHPGYDDEPTVPMGAPPRKAPSNQFPHPIQARYRCLGILGEGSSGAVYKAFDSQLQREVAIKFIHQDQLQERKRLLAEARVLAQLEHPNICKVYEVAEEGEAVYLVMSLINGAHLNQWREQLTKYQLVRIIAGVAGALEVAHQKGIVHCDVKPSNMVLRDDRQQVEAVLVDFGIAHAGPASTTVSGAGTAHYMAPERTSANASEALSPAVDVFALGATLRFLLTGSHNCDLQSLDEDLRLIIDKCLREAPTERYRSAGALQQDLQAWLDWRPISLRRSPVYFLQRFWQRNAWFRGTSATAISIGLVALFAFASYQQTLNQRQLEQLSIGEQVTQREYQIESIYRAPVYPLKDDLKQLKNDADRWFSDAARHPDWLAATLYAAAGRVFYQLLENNQALKSLERAWELGDRSDRTASAYALTLNRFYFDAIRQARTLPNEEARAQASLAARQLYAQPAQSILSELDYTHFPRDYVRALELHLAEQSLDALTLLQNGQFPQWFYQRYELMLQVADEALHEILDGYADGDYLMLLDIHDEAFQQLTARTPSFMPAYSLRASALMTLQVTRENLHHEYNDQAKSWLDELPELYQVMGYLDSEHPDFLFTRGRYHTLLSTRPHLTDQPQRYHFQQGLRDLEHSLRMSHRRRWSEAHQVHILRGVLAHYNNFMVYLSNHNQPAAAMLARYQVLLSELPERYRGNNYYMNLGNALHNQGRLAESLEQRDLFFAQADDAYAQGLKRTPNHLGVQANYARILNTWAAVMPTSRAQEARQRALELISSAREQAPQNIAVQFNYGVIHLDQAGLHVFHGDSYTAQRMLKSADHAFSIAVELSPSLDILRQRWSDVYIFFNQHLAQPLDSVARHEAVQRILDLDNFAVESSLMSYVRYLELLLQRYEASNDPIHFATLQSFITAHLLDDDGHPRSPDVARALAYMALNDEQNMVSRHHIGEQIPQLSERAQHWLQLAHEYYQQFPYEQYDEIHAKNTANVLTAQLLALAKADSDEDRQRHQVQLRRYCERSVYLVEQGYVQDIFAVETMRAWRLINAHASHQCAPDTALLQNEATQ